VSIYRWAMRFGSPLLFWLSILIVLASLLQVYDTVQQAQAQIGFGGISFFSRFRILLSTVGQGFLLAALPFGTAVIINRIDKFLTTREGPRK
jgi:hypothetical protein